MENYTNKLFILLKMLYYDRRDEFRQRLHSLFFKEGNIFCIILSGARLLPQILDQFIHFN
jgi:hypothetical protein